MNDSREYCETPYTSGAHDFKISIFRTTTIAITIHHHHLHPLIHSHDVSVYSAIHMYMQDRSNFQGEQLHARNVSSSHYHHFHNKNVVILGNSNTVWDTLAECTVAAAKPKSIQILHRKVLWPVAYDDPRLMAPRTAHESLARLGDQDYYTGCSQGIIGRVKKLLQEGSRKRAAEKKQKMQAHNYGMDKVSQPCNCMLIRTKSVGRC